MTCYKTFLALFSITLLWGQQDWQGDVKKIYKIDIPAFQGVQPVFGLAKKTATMPDIELYSLTLKMSNLKTSADFYRLSMEKQGFKPVKTTSNAALERIEMLNSARKLVAVVVASKQNQNMLLGISVMPEGTIKH